MRILAPHVLQDLQQKMVFSRVADQVGKTALAKDIL